ncbi:MAG: Bro-N domain-containing protein [Candidatus Fonsibacter sp.]
MRPSKAIIDHVPDKYNKPLEFLMATSVGPISGPTDLNDHTNQKKAMFINEAGLYRLTLRSKSSKAEEFTDWVCSEVLPRLASHIRRVS